MKLHDTVRITNETKNGRSSRNRKKDLNRPPWNAIQYASGYARTRATAVTIALLRSDRTRNSQFLEVASVKLAKCHVRRYPSSAVPSCNARLAIATMGTMKRRRSQRPPGA